MNKKELKNFALNMKNKELTDSLFAYIAPPYRLALGIVDDDNKVRVVRFYFEESSNIKKWLKKLQQKIDKGKLDLNNLRDKYYCRTHLKSIKKMFVIADAQVVMKEHKNHFFNTERKYYGSDMAILYEDGTFYKCLTDKDRPTFEHLIK